MKELKEAREAAGISQDKLAQQLGISPSTLSRYENNSGDRIDMRLTLKICDLLDYSHGRLMKDLDRRFSCASRRRG